ALAPTELRLLLELSRVPRRVLSRQQLLEAVWEHDYLGDSRLVDACVQRLRAKIEDDPATPVYVQTVRGFGYRFGPLGPLLRCGRKTTRAGRRAGWGYAPACCWPSRCWRWSRRRSRRACCTGAPGRRSCKRPRTRPRPR